jgi:hypothetical protein
MEQPVPKGQSVANLQEALHTLSKRAPGVVWQSPVAQSKPLWHGQPTGKLKAPPDFSQVLLAAQL